jgi:AraC family transcriptional regulator of adaptative response/methylated-DNA-[protein]-cysteine methyltransferase
MRKENMISLPVEKALNLLLNFDSSEKIQQTSFSETNSNVDFFDSARIDGNMRYNLKILVCCFIMLISNKICTADESDILPGLEYSRHHQIIQYQQQEHDLLYTRLVAKEQTSEYFVGVKTTGIACRFGCPANPPFQQNCIFSKKLHDLICYGMRECKVCKPLSHNAPEDTKELLNSIQSTWFPEKKFGAQHTKAKEWVQENHNTDLLKYVCAKRSNGFLQNRTDTPLPYANILTYQRYLTPIGVMLACFSEKGLCLLEFNDRRMLESELLTLQKRYKAKFTLRSSSISKQLDTELDQYFKGIQHDFSVPLDQRGSDFQVSVWQALKEIPYGTTTSYKKQAILLRRPEAIRAVANANGNNSISILIPCHRVIGENGNLMGYGGGLERKQYLLNLERHFVDTIVNLPLKRIRLK